MIEDNDETIERVARALKPLPPVNAKAVANILAATRAQKNRAPSRVTLVLEWMREPTFSFASGGMLLAAGLALGFITNRAISSVDEPATFEAARSTTAPVMSASTVAEVVRQIPMPMVLNDASAKSVSIVGDFNGWDSAASPMTRDASNGPWTVTVKVTPGRHLYAFMVDGKLVVDSRAPKVRDIDFGGEANVMLVNTP